MSKSKRNPAKGKLNPLQGMVILLAIGALASPLVMTNLLAADFERMGLFALLSLGAFVMAYKRANDAWDALHKRRASELGSSDSSAS